MPTMSPTIWVSRGPLFGKANEFMYQSKLKYDYVKVKTILYCIIFPIEEGKLKKVKFCVGKRMGESETMRMLVPKLIL